jgi:hypothetical protein
MSYVLKGLGQSPTPFERLCHGVGHRPPQLIALHLTRLRPFFRQELLQRLLSGSFHKQ